MKPERKLYHDLKHNTQGIIWNRIENTINVGMPDLLGYNDSQKLFTVELKIAKGNKVRLSPHQISWHTLHPNNSFILIRKDRRLILVKGSEIHKLAAGGFDACAIVADTWDSVRAAFATSVT